jgi:hypothetical protein
MNLLNLLQGSMSQDILQKLSGQIGAQNTEQTQNASNDIFSAMIGAMSKNTATPQGAESLNNALEKDHSANAFGNFNIMGMLGGMGGSNSSGILKHIFGNLQQQITQQISQKNGISEESTSSLMTMLAPLLMSQMGTVKQQNGMNSNDLQQYLHGEKEQIKQQNPQANNILGFLDGNGDGNIMDDLGGMLNKLF